MKKTWTLSVLAMLVGVAVISTSCAPNQNSKRISISEIESDGDVQCDDCDKKEIEEVKLLVSADGCEMENEVCAFRFVPDQNGTTFSWAVKKKSDVDLNFHIRSYGYEDDVYFVVCADTVCGMGNDPFYLDYDNSDFTYYVDEAHPDVLIYQIRTPDIFEGSLEIQSQENGINGLVQHGSYVVHHN